MTRTGRIHADLFRWISTASGSERDSKWSAIATARGTDPYTHISTPYIDLQSDLVLIRDDPSYPRSIDRTPTW